MKTKVCTKCLQDLPIDNFYIRDEKKEKYYSQCKGCISDRIKNPDVRKRKREYCKNYYQEHKEQINAKTRELYGKNADRILGYKRKWRKENKEHIKQHNKEIRDNLRRQFLEMYGGKCACCKETIEEFLTIQHIEGQIGIPRTKKQVGSNAYRYAVREYRPDLYEILCWNCNCSKGRYGYCPHEKL